MIISDGVLRSSGLESLTVLIQRIGHRKLSLALTEHKTRDKGKMSKIAVETLVNRIEQVIQIHRDAEDLTIGEVIGILEIIKLDLYQETVEQD